MRIVIYIALVLFAVTACKKNQVTIDNLNGGVIKILGHGGMGIGSLYPINTQESILKCINTGALGSEIDVQLTSDNQLVAFHNETMDENTNFTGRIRDYSWTKLKDARYTSTPQLNYKLLNIREFLSELGNLDQYVFTLDVKLYPGDEDFDDYIEDFTDAIADLYADIFIDTTVFVESQSTDFLNRLYEKDTQIPLYIYPSSFSEGLDIAMGLGLRGISIDNDLVTREDVAAAHAVDIRVTLWGVNSKSENIDAVNKHPDMIQSDKLKQLVRYLEP